MAVAVAQPQDVGDRNVVDIRLARRIDGDQVPVQVWLAREPVAMLTGHVRGIPYELAWSGQLDACRTVLGTLERVFARFQHVEGVRHAPPDYDARSLAVGDVVTFVRSRESWAIAHSGWQRVPLYVA